MFTHERQSAGVWKPISQEKYSVWLLPKVETGQDLSIYQIFKTVSLSFFLSFFLSFSLSIYICIADFVWDLDRRIWVNKIRM